MRKISSGSLSAMKRVFPVLWFGFLAFAVTVGISSGAYRKAPLVIVMPLVMMAFGYFLFKKLLWDLADEVHDGGDFLLVKMRGEQDRVLLSNIMNVSASVAMNPPRITLRLRVPGKFGDEIAFSPVKPFTLNPFARNAIAEDLMVRVDKARPAHI
jgi:hypothetical protein